LQYVFVRRSDMSKLIGLAFAAMLLLPSANPVREKFAKYKAIEAYEIRPGILMMPRYSDDGQVCEIGLEKLHYSPEIIRLDSSLESKDIDQIFDELVPANERGPRLNDSSGDLIVRSGHGMTTNVEYENVLIQIVDKELSSSRHGVTVEGAIVATIHWKHRKCQ
jgi:hypothetical protein